MFLLQLEAALLEVAAVSSLCLCSWLSSPTSLVAALGLAAATGWNMPIELYLNKTKKQKIVNSTRVQLCICHRPVFP
jgi:hypothetical protein